MPATDSGPGGELGCLASLGMGVGVWVFCKGTVALADDIRTVIQMSGTLFVNPQLWKWLVPANRWSAMLVC